MIKWCVSTNFFCLLYPVVETAADTRQRGTRQPGVLGVTRPRGGQSFTNDILLLFYFNTPDPFLHLPAHSRPSARKWRNNLTA